MGRRFSPALFAAALAILAGDRAEGQNRNTGLSGGSGVSSFGGSGLGGSSFGSSFGGSGFGASGFGASGFGSGFGQSGLGGSSFGTGSGSGTSGTTTFVGRGVETAFVGRGAGLQTQNFTTTTQRSDRGGRSDSASLDNPRPSVRVRLTAAPELLAATAAPTLSPMAVSRLARRRGLGGVSITTEAGVTRLEGVVATESQRLLAEKLMAIEPGVGRIDNRLVVTPQELVPAPR